MFCMIVCFYLNIQWYIINKLKIVHFKIVNSYNYAYVEESDHSS